MKVWGGMTGAGRKKDLKPAHGAWTCADGHENRGTSRRCLTLGCNKWRPDCDPAKEAA